MAPNFPHWHTCEECLHSWKHKPLKHIGSYASSDAEIREHHMCPECDAGPWVDADRYKYEALARAKALAKLSPQERLERRQAEDSLHSLFAALGLYTGGSDE